MVLGAHSCVKRFALSYSCDWASFCRGRGAFAVYMHAARSPLTIAVVMIEFAPSFCSEFLQSKVGSPLSVFVVVIAVVAAVEAGSVVVAIVVTEVLGNKALEVGALAVVVVVVSSLLLLAVCMGPCAICIVAWVELAHSPLASFLLAVEFPILLFCPIVLDSRWWR